MQAQIQSPSQNWEPNAHSGPHYPEANRTPGDHEYYHDRNAHDLRPSVAGQHEWEQNQSTKRCFPGTVKCKRQEPRSYEVQIESGATIRRKRHHLRPTSAQRIEMDFRDEDTNSGSEEYPVNVLPNVPESTEPPHSTVTSSPLNDVSATPASPTKIPKETNAEPYRTMSGRAVNRPVRFAD